MIDMTEPVSWRVGYVPDHARISRIAIGLTHRQCQHPLVKRVIQSQIAIQVRGRWIVEHVLAYLFPRGADIRPFDQAQR